VAQQPIFNVPLRREFIQDAGRYAYRIIFSVEIQDQFGNFVPLPFRLDTGSDFTTLPIKFAHQFGIPFDKSHPISPRTGAGKAKQPSYLSPIWFSLPGFPRLMFRTDCLFSPGIDHRGLFSLNDLVPHFLVRSKKATSQYPHGFVVLQLRKDHQGVVRP
jgi:hypothetical protein